MHYLAVMAVIVTLIVLASFPVEAALVHTPLVLLWYQVVYTLEMVVVMVDREATEIHIAARPSVVGAALADTLVMVGMQVADLRVQHHRPVAEAGVVEAACLLRDLIHRLAVAVAVAVSVSMVKVLVVLLAAIWEHLLTMEIPAEVAQAEKMV
jgi:hypothetical protein